MRFLWLEAKSRILIIYLLLRHQVKEIAQNYVAEEFASGISMSLKWQSHAILALQEAAEAYLVHLFEDA